jgi:hypothetical protein
MDNVLTFLYNYWSNECIPKYLQMDNAAYFIGAIKHQRHFSNVLRLCLYMGVEPVIIAPKKPWMNGPIEDFNGDFNTKLWERVRFRDLKHVCDEGKIFLKRHSNRQSWKTQGFKIESYPTI